MATSRLKRGEVRIGEKGGNVAAPTSHSAPVGTLEPVDDNAPSPAGTIDWPVAQQTRRKKRGHYTRAQRITAVTAAIATNAEHPMSRQSFDAMRSTLDDSTISDYTLQQWVRELRGEITPLIPSQPTNAELVRQTADQIVGQWLNVERRYIGRLGEEDVINKAAARDAAVVAGIARTHLTKMTGLAPELEALVQQCLALCTSADEMVHWQRQLYNYLLAFKAQSMPALEMGEKDST